MTEGYGNAGVNTRRTDFRMKFSHNIEVTCRGHVARNACVQSLPHENLNVVMRETLVLEIFCWASR